LDLEAVEMAMRAAMHQAGAAALSQLLQYEPPGAGECEIPCPCGHKARYREMRARHVLTAVGQIEVQRPWYLCRQCHNGQFPADTALDIEKMEFSPGVRRMLALVGSDAPFDHGRKQIELLAGLKVTTKAVERTAESIGNDIALREQTVVNRALQLDLPIIVCEPIPILYVQMDGTGVPVVKKETAGRAGKVNGQPAHTREVKFGCVFTQTTWDDEGYAIRDPGSTTYTGAIETAGEFGNRIYLEAWNRGWSRAEKKVVIGDGAEWIWNNADRHFPGAIQIVDLFHSRQHLWNVARLIHPGDMPRQKQWILRHQPKLDNGKIQKLVLFLRNIDRTTPAIAEPSESRRPTSNTTQRECATPNSVASTCSSAPVSLKLDAKLSSAPDSNSPVCFGPSMVQTPSSPSAAVTSTTERRTIGNHDVPPELPLLVAHPGCFVCQGSGEQNATKGPEYTA